MKSSTLLFLVKKNNEAITDVLLAMKKRGFGIGKWNGVGGKVEDGESVEEAIIRETYEEISVSVEKADLIKVAELEFNFIDNPAWDQKVHVYITSMWSGDPRESEEMAPRWYSTLDIPYDSMWDDDKYWLPRVLSGEYVIDKFTFDQHGKVINNS